MTWAYYGAIFHSCHFHIPRDSPADNGQAGFFSPHLRRRERSGRSAPQGPHCRGGSQQPRDPKPGTLPYAREPPPQVAGDQSEQ